MSDIALPEASPRDREVQHVVMQLVEVYAFSEAHAILERRLKEIAESRTTRTQKLFLDWSELDRADRPDFLTYAHHRRNPEIGQ